MDRPKNYTFADEREVCDFIEQYRINRVEYAQYCLTQNNPAAQSTGYYILASWEVPSTLQWYKLTIAAANLGHAGACADIILYALKSKNYVTAVRYFEIGLGNIGDTSFDCALIGYSQSKQLYLMLSYKRSIDNILKSIML